MTFISIDHPPPPNHLGCYVQNAAKWGYCIEKPSCEMRFIEHYPKTVFGIYDKQSIFIITVSKTGLQSSPALWSNNDALISLASAHFEELWQRAQKPELKDVGKH
ncbi:TPA: hypothetical protein HA273_02565 [Candidatus Bathyarchaeota archaeon]|nr:hypothetical protein [Candidatus Bathyarchaeota archaeon]